MSAVAIDLDGALGDTHALWNAFLEDAARRFHSIAPLDVPALPADRGAAAALLDAWATAGVGDWRSTLERFAEDCAPVHLRTAPGASGAVRSAARAGMIVGVFTDAPEELARVALAHLGVARSVEAVEGGSGALERLLARLGPGTVIARTAAELATISADGAAQAPR